MPKLLSCYYLLPISNWKFTFLHLCLPQFFIKPSDDNVSIWEKTTKNFDFVSSGGILRSKNARDCYYAINIDAFRCSFSNLSITTGLVSCLKVLIRTVLYAFFQLKIYQFCSRPRYSVKRNAGSCSQY